MARNTGPVPKRSTERRRRNRVDIDSAPLHTGGVKLGPACPRSITGLARRWYESLRTSGQAVYYTDSDWATALVVATAIQRFEARPNANMLSAILAGCASLAVTEGERRRLRLELGRADDEGDVDEAAAVASLDDYRRAVGG